MICGLAKIRSVHTYVIPWIHWFEPNCMSLLLLMACHFEENYYYYFLRFHFSGEVLSKSPELFASIGFCFQISISHLIQNMMNFHSFKFVFVLWLEKPHALIFLYFLMFFCIRPGKVPILLQVLFKDLRKFFPKKPWIIYSAVHDRLDRGLMQIVFS